jgi:hypothetical protein
MRVQAWLNEGWSREIALIGVRQAIAKNCSPWPPKSVQFFEGWITTAMARQASPLPAPRMAEQRSLPLLGVVSGKDSNYGGNRASPSKGGAFAAGLDRLDRLSEQQRLQTGGAEPGEGSNRDGGRDDPGRELPPRRNGVA